MLGHGEEGVAGVAVQLRGADSHVLATTVTSKTGHYTFDHLSAGSYQIRFSKLPQGLMFTSQDAGDNPALDSDANQTGMTSAFDLGSDNPADLSIDAGLTTPGNYRGMPGSSRPPVDTALSTTGGVAPQIPLAGLALAAAGAGCLVIARRRRKI